MAYFCVLAILYGVFALLINNQQVNTRKQKLLVFIALFPLFFLTGFRSSNVGNDTFIYVRAFDYISHFDTLRSSIINSRFEPGYAILNYICAKMGLSFVIMQVLTSIFIYISIGQFVIKYSRNIWLSCYIFLTLRFAFGPMNVVRMWIAVAILLFSVRFLESRKPIHFFAIVIIASLFHVSALVFILLWPASMIKWNLKRIGFIFLIACCILFFARPFFVWVTHIIGRYSGYLNSRYFSENNIATLLSFGIDLLFFAFICLERRKKENIDYSLVDRHIKTDILFVAAIIAIAIDIIGLSNSIMNRVSNYYRIFMILSIPDAIGRLHIRSNIWIVKSIILITLALQFFVILIYRPYWSGVIPYTFIWE